MTALDAIYAAVLAHPHDDVPRGAYADWLDDQGTPEATARAAFIRAQLELARLSGCLDLTTYTIAFADDGGAIMTSPGGQAATCNDRATAGGCVSVCGQCGMRASIAKRERELFDRHKCEWFGGDRWAVLTLPDDDPDLMPDLTTAVVRRGFVDEIRLPLAAFVGGECQRCGGEGRIGQHHDPSSDTMRGGTRCLTCAGTGRTPGLARDLFAAHPVTRVVLTDREPSAWEFPGTPAVFAWHRHPFAAGGFTDPDDLPFGLWDRVESASVESGRVEGGRWKRFATLAAALDALSAACVAYGRKLAGLPAAGG